MSAAKPRRRVLPVVTVVALAAVDGMLCRLRTHPGPRSGFARAGAPQTGGDLRQDAVQLRSVAAAGARCDAAGLHDGQVRRAWPTSDRSLLRSVADGLTQSPQR